MNKTQSDNIEEKVFDIVTKVNSYFTEKQKEMFDGFGKMVSYLRNSFGTSEQDTIQVLKDKYSFTGKELFLIYSNFLFYHTEHIKTAGISKEKLEKIQKNNRKLIIEYYEQSPTR